MIVPHRPHTILQDLLVQLAHAREINSSVFVGLNVVVLLTKLEEILLVPHLLSFLDIVEDPLHWPFFTAGGASGTQLGCSSSIGLLFSFAIIDHFIDLVL